MPTPPAAPRPRSSSTWKWVLLGVAAALSVCCCLPMGAGGGLFWYGATREWPEFTSTEGRFAVRMPGTPTYSKQGLGTHQHIYQSPLGTFNAAYLNDLPSEGEATVRFAFIVGKPETFVLGDYPGATLISQRGVSFGPHTGQEFTLDTAQKIRVVKRFYLVKRRVYVLTAVKATERSQARFFDSFRVIEPTDGAAVKQ